MIDEPASPPRAGSTLDWRAIAAGAGATVAIGVSVSFLMQAAFVEVMPLGYGTLLALSGLASLVAAVVGGATAGALAQRRGAVHGALAMVLAIVFGLAVTVVMLGRKGQIGALSTVGYWVHWLVMALLGLGVGTVAGLVAAPIAAAKSSR